MFFRKSLLSFIAVLALASSAFATDVVISSSVIPSAVFGNLGPNRSVTVTATNGSAAITVSANWPAQLVGVTGYRVAINGSDYVVSTTNSTSSVTLATTFSGSNGSYTATIYPVVLLRVYSSQSFTPLGASYVFQAGSPSVQNGFFVQYGCSVEAGSLYIPAVTLPSQLDAANAQDRVAQYSAYFFSTSGALLQPYGGFTSFQVPATPTSTTWPLLSTYNAPSSTYQLDMYTYSRDQIASLLANLTLSYLALPLVSKTSNYTLVSTDFGVNCTSGTFSVTLPSAASSTGKIYMVKNSGTGVITLATSSGDQIDGYASGSITLIQYDAMLLQSSGTTWVILSYS